MARKKRNRSDQRDISSIANFVADRTFSPRASSPVTFVTRPRVALHEIEDRRTYHPLGFFRPARSFRAAQHSLQVKQPKRNKDRFASLRSATYVPSQIQFKAPKKVILCVRRKQRREVIHALKKTGKGARARRRRNYFSDINC